MVVRYGLRQSLQIHIGVMFVCVGTANQGYISDQQTMSFIRLSVTMASGGDATGNHKMKGCEAK